MANETFTQVPEDSTGNKIRGHASSAPIGGHTVQTQASALTDPDVAGAVQKITATAPAADAYGAVVRVPEPGAASVANVDQSASEVTLLASNAARRGFVIDNDSESHQSDLFVKFGAGASLTSYTRRIRAGDAWERAGGYTGVITGIWDSAGGGKARVTEES